MGFRHTLPPLALRPFVDRFWSVNTAAPSLILPDNCADIVLSRGRPAQVVGVMSTAAEAGSGPGAVVGVRFHPGGMCALLGLPGEPLRDQSGPAR